MSKRIRTLTCVEKWCGKKPALGTDLLRALWERHGPNGVPFEDEGAEKLIQILDDEFGPVLRPVDIIPLSFDGLVDAIPDAADVPVAASRGPAPVPQVVTLSDETLDRLAQRIAEQMLARTASAPESSPPVAPRRAARPPAASRKKSSSRKAAAKTRKPTKTSSKRKKGR